VEGLKLNKNILRIFGVLNIANFVTLAFTSPAMSAEADLVPQLLCKEQRYSGDPVVELNKEFKSDKWKNFSVSAPAVAIKNGYGIVCVIMTPLKKP
jgi:hypothetical protein